MRGSTRPRPVHRRFVGLVERILGRGATEGVFRSGIDPVRLNITVAAVGSHCFTNRHTDEILFERDYMTDGALSARLNFNFKTIPRLVLKSPR